MLDVVPNHMGLQDDCDNGDDGCKQFSQFVPFDRIEYYHDWCAIEDYDDQREVEECWLNGQLTDLDQANPEVDDLLCRWIANATETYGFDGYRVDTTRHIAQDFYPGYGEAANAYLVGTYGVFQWILSFIFIFYFCGGGH